ncbi:hypothetical protein CFC21_039881 [Triticum aestivum]|uniref:F-box domain-containing protein n=2 Tax=Triticum aestivum TaxID=4565 RepID=A0A9R1FFJ2_WHEAT|nr:hypothetical protein CFC21_039881 [Triticum aestivum]CDM81345.1 unnamed protein product [Triticum aestivum]
MDAPAACEIERLPEDLLVHVISLTSPAGAIHATAVSRAFHAAADSDTVWSRLLARDLPQFAKRELPRKPPSTKKGMFRRLSDEPALLPGKYVAISASTCILLSVPKVPRFSQAADIGHVNILKICAKIQRNMLSQNITYVAYMVFKLGPRFYCFDFPFQEASFGVVGTQSIQQVCLQGYVEDGDGTGVPPRKHIMPSSYSIYNRDEVPTQKNVVFPRKKADGWMEVELGEFHNEGGDGEVSISLTETTKPKSGLIVWGIVIRSKQQKKKEEVSNKGQ